jgi:hypothetical protein
MIRNILIFAIHLLLFCVLLMSEEEWKEISDYREKIRVEDKVYIAIVLDERVEMENVDPENRVGKELYEILKKYFSGYYKFPWIEKEIKADFIKNYKLFYIKDLLGAIDGPSPMVFAVSRDGKEIHAFGGLEYSDTRRRAIKFFNKMIKKEKIKVDDPAFALDICMLFVKIACFIKTEIVKNPNEIEMLFEKWYGDNKEKELKELRMPIHAPLCRKEGNKYRLLFLTYNGVIEQWHFEVSKRGQIKLVNLIRTLRRF